MKTACPLIIAVLAAALFSASPASATELYSGSTTLGVNATIDASLEPNTSAELTDTAGKPVDTCTTSTVHGAISVAGSATSTAKGEIETLTWGSAGDLCTQPLTTTVAKGQLEVHHIAGTHDGTITGKGTVVDILVFGVHCLYGTEPATDLGVLLGKTGLTEHATVFIKAVIPELEPNKFTCPDTTRWVASYTVTSLTGLNVRAS